MTNPDQNRAEHEIERLREALEAETRRCLEVQEKLDAANTEFEEFVSAAAHDLGEPLRDVAAFSQLIAETCAGRLDPDAAVFLERIQEGAVRMQSLLTDVVDYWAVGTGDGPASRTDMEAALRQALLSTEKLAVHRGALVTHDPLPEVMGHFEILAKVLNHLIVNAIEYCDKSGPRVHVSCRRDNSGWIISVQDNGPGIAPEFRDRIFGVFKRLHGKEYPGTGLGLAFCKKAIQGHGGRMWVESTLWAGSTFFFTLPPAG
jgi:light-regulated signal transduction histidine kinase (bacteriophytochrome)